MRVAIPFVRNVFALLHTMVSASAINDFIQEKMQGGGDVRAKKGITSVISNKDRDDFIRIIKSQENSCTLFNGVSQILKLGTKNQEDGFLGMLLQTLGASLLGNMLTGKLVIKAERGYDNKYFEYYQHY